jgi:hypothetical protein
MAIPKRRKNEAPIPTVFPGEFFLLRWDRDRERFFLELDDESGASYDLGSDPLHVVSLLRLRGYERFSREDAVDRAREFGMCQCIPEPGGGAEVKLRLVQILPRTPTLPPLFPETPAHAWFPGL